MIRALSREGGLSFTSPRVKRLRQLIARSAVRDREKAFVVEGPVLVADSLDAGSTLECLFVALGHSSPVVDRAVDMGIPVHDLAPGVLERLAGTVTPQPVLAVAATMDVSLSELAGTSLVLVCVDIADPGNLGTILRSAEAAGVGGIICCDGSVDIYNPKCVRASAGSLFHTRIVARGKPVDVLATLGDWGLQRLGTRADEGTPYHRVDFTVPTALVLGNEAHGLPAVLSDGPTSALDGWITIPMAGRAESLNVAMATSVLCFEAARQRSS